MPKSPDIFYTHEPDAIKAQVANFRKADAQRTSARSRRTIMGAAVAISAGGIGTMAAAIFDPKLRDWTIKVYIDKQQEAVDRPSVETVNKGKTPSATPTTGNQVLPSQRPAIPQVGSETNTGRPSPEVRKVLTIKDLLTTNPDNNPVVASAREIMKFPPMDPKRREIEIALVQRLQRENAQAPLWSDVLKVCTNSQARGWAMEILWRMRQSKGLEIYGLKPLDEAKVEWATKNKIDPRILAFTIDMRVVAQDLLFNSPELYLGKVNKTPEDLNRRLINSGGAAKLAMWETGRIHDLNEKPENNLWGYVNIGTATALSQINTSQNWLKNADEQLKWIAAHHQETTGIPYSEFVDNIPGSRRGSEDSSGGALGPQFMPPNAVEQIKLHEQANDKIGNRYAPMNMFGLNALVLPYLFIAQRGYYAGDEKAIKNALNRWNQHPKQVNDIYETAVSYYDQFVKRG